jgi:hypothetical protein
MGIPKSLQENRKIWFSESSFFVLMPIISGGMAVFGYYALTGEYSDDKS